MWQGGGQAAGPGGMPMQGMPFPGMQMQMQGVPYGMAPQYMQGMGMHPQAFPPFPAGVMGMPEPVAPTAGGKVRRKRKKQEKGGPKKPATAFVMFSNEQRETVKAENPGISFTDIGRKLGEMWREMEPDVKKEYEQRAMTAKDKYMAEKKVWLETKDGGGGGGDDAETGASHPMGSIAGGVSSSGATAGADSPGDEEPHDKTKIETAPVGQDTALAPNSTFASENGLRAISAAISEAVAPEATGMGLGAGTAAGAGGGESKVE